MLTIDTAVSYLLDRGLVTARSIVDGELAVVSAVRRNRNLRVERTDGPGYLVKQPDDPASGGRHTLWREAAFYDLCRREPALAEVAGLLPRLVHFDAEGPLLALELLARPATLWEHYSRFPPAEFPAETARAVGRALGTVHRAGLPLAADPRLAAGIAGLSEIVLLGAGMLGDDSWRAVAARTAGELVRRYAGAGDWPSGMPSGGPSPALMLGSAGIGHHLLRLHAPERVPPVLVILPEWRGMGSAW